MTVRTALATRLHPARLRARAHPVEKVRSHLKRILVNLATGTVSNLADLAKPMPECVSMARFWSPVVAT